MDIKRSDFILILDLEDIHGEKMRVADTAEFTIRVWTNDPTHYLTFKRRDIISDDYNDRIAIDKMQMECLHSGVVVYDYDYSKWNADFCSTDEKYNKVKTVVTDVYWRNVINADNPCNVVNYQTIEHIYDLIEAERLDREQEFHELKDYVGKDFTDKLNAEIKRSNEVDIEFHKLIKSNKEDADNKATELNNKLDAEIEHSNNVDTELNNVIQTNKADCDSKNTATNEKVDAEIARSSQKDADLENAIDTEVTRATNAETVINTKLEGEIERAKTAEGAIRDAVENERDRAIAKETLINDSLTSEIARAKQVETDITTNLQALKTAVETEKQRSADKDTEHTNSLNQLSAKLDTEISRAKAAEKANADAIAILNGDKNTIGSIAHCLDDSKHYTDDEIAKIKAEQNTALANFATKNEVNAVDGKLTAHISNADSTYAKKSDIYTKTEVDDLIDGVDVTSQIKPISDRVTALEGIDHTQYLTSHQSLTDYAKKTETTAIKDENGNVITEMVIDNSSADDSVELYTKEQCDERFALKGETGGSVDLSNYYTKSEVDTQFAKIWVGTQSEYDAITTKNSSTLYIIK